MSFTSVIGRSLEVHERLLTLRPYLTVGLPLIGERLARKGVVWVEENQPRVSSLLTMLSQLETTQCHLLGRIHFYQRRRFVIFLGSWGYVDTIADRGRAFLFGHSLVHQQARVLCKLWWEVGGIDQRRENRRCILHRDHYYSDVFLTPRVLEQISCREGLAAGVSRVAFSI